MVAFGFAGSCRFNFSRTPVDANGLCKAGPCHIVAFGRPGSCASAIAFAWLQDDRSEFGKASNDEKITYLD